MKSDLGKREVFVLSSLCLIFIGIIGVLTSKYDWFLGIEIPLLSRILIYSMIIFPCIGCLYLSMFQPKIMKIIGEIGNFILLLIVVLLAIFIFLNLSKIGVIR